MTTSLQVGLTTAAIATVATAVGTMLGHDDDAGEAMAVAAIAPAILIGLGVETLVRGARPLGSMTGADMSAIGRLGGGIAGGATDLALGPPIKTLHNIS